MPVHLHFPAGNGGAMSKFERLLEAGSTELPDCRCGAEMNLVTVVLVSDGDTEIRIFRCPNCGHELRLTSWRTEVSAA
jgi:DNA-directed RNA polymerase subunit RPC12/RpoP